MWLVATVLGSTVLETWYPQLLEASQGGGHGASSFLSSCPASQGSQVTWLHKKSDANIQGLQPAAQDPP